MKKKSQRQKQLPLPEEQPHPLSFEALLRESETSPNLTQYRGARLARAASKAIMTAKGVAQFAHLLDAVDLDPSDITEEVIAVAEALERQGRIRSEEWVEKINDMVRELNRRRGFLPDLPAAVDVDPEPPPGPGKEPGRGKLFGHSATAVIRWMAADGLDKKQVKAILRNLSIDVADNTVKIQHRAGVQGKDIPELSNDAANAIYDALG